MTKAKSTRNLGRSINRTSQNRNSYPLILIICESRETEPNYFKALCEYYKLTSVRIMNGVKGDSHSALKAALRKIERDKIKFDEYDEIWFVFDHEDESRHQIYEKTIKECEEKKIKVAWSNPCFELWFLLHFVKTDKPLPNYKAVEKELSKSSRLLEYSKEDKTIFKRIHEKTQDAINNSEGLWQHQNNQFNNESCCPNPRTCVHHLILTLQKINPL